jgi:hypothetical protein
MARVEGEVLFEIDTWLIAFALLVGGVGVSELTSRLGRRWRASFDDTARTNLTTLAAALLALIGILLAFSLSMSVMRFDQRRELMVEEVNAIGTAWLRSGICEEPARSRLRSQLRDYTKSRADLFGSTDYARAPESAKGQAIRDSVWKEASTVAVSDPHSIQNGLLIQAINQMIDLHTSRDVANHNHVPEPVWLLLIFITLLAMASVGFLDAQGSVSNLGARIAMTLALAATLSLNMDLDRPRRGVIRVSQAPMLELYDSMSSQP